MIFQCAELFGINKRELDTEIRFAIASARADGAELIKFICLTPTDLKEEKRLRGCILRVLRTMRIENAFQFFLFDENLKTEATEAEYLRNKYSGFITEHEERFISVYVRL